MNIAGASRLILIAVSVAMLTVASRADTYTYWQHDPNTPGDFGDPDNWTSGVPEYGDTAWINNGGTAVIDSGSFTTGRMLGIGGDGFVPTCILIQNGGELGTEGMTLGTGGGAGRYELHGGSYHARSNVVAIGGAQYDTTRGEFVQDGGTVDLSQSTDLNIRATGSYSLGGHGELIADRVFVGTGGGLFSQTGGSVSGTWMRIGYGSSLVPGTYELSGGQLSFDRLSVGEGAAGVPGYLNQTGGDLAVEELYVGWRGLYRYAGGTWEVDRIFELDGTLDLEQA